MRKPVAIASIIALSVGVGIGYVGAGVLAKISRPIGSRNASGHHARAIKNAYTGSSGVMSTAGGTLFGIVARKDTESITVDTHDGNSHVVLFTPDTSVSKSMASSIAAVTVGSSVVVSGVTNSDGSVSASSIQLQPTGTP